MLMRGDSASDGDGPLALAIMEFQGLTKILLKKWRDVAVNVELAEHKRALKTIHLLSKPEPYMPTQNANGTKTRKHHPEKWRRLGFETESPAWEFDDTGYLGMMDLVEYCRRNEDTYQKTLLEQSVLPREERCPLARSSLSVTLILFEHFEIDNTAEADLAEYRNSLDTRRREERVDKMYKPLLLQWGRLHAAALNAFLRLWKDAGAEHDDFYKIEEIIRIAVERIVGSASRKTDVGKVEEDLRTVSLAATRAWQMEDLNEVYQEAWGPHLVQVREQLHNESSQFMKEQRIRCMLQGSWFPTTATPTAANAAWRFVQLGQNRRFLQYQNYPTKGDREPSPSELTEKIDLNFVTSVDSNVSASEQPIPQIQRPPANDSSETLRDSTALTHPPGPLTNTKITILGTSPGLNKIRLDGAAAAAAAATDERVLLELFPQTSFLASEWLDGLLMLLDQQPITKDTTRLIEMMEDWGVRLRMLNLRWEDVDWEALETSVKGGAVDAQPVPGREGVGDGYWYALPDEVDA